MTDLSLRQIVTDELEFEPSVNAAHIGVAVDKAVVMLTGHVASYAEKFSAMGAVRRLKGVRAIADEIEVRYADDKKTSDDEIAKRAIDILNWDIAVPSGAIQVAVRNGWVTLNGDVDWKFQKKTAEDDVRRLSGVHGIFNNIEIKPHVQSGAIQRKIEDALKRYAGLEAEAIRVTIRDNNKVLIEGKVGNWSERNVVKNAVWSAPGVKSIEDRLTIA